MTNRNQPALGVHLLETITRGMYSQPLHCIREYIQNAYDSIREARRLTSLTAAEGEVRLLLDEDAERLTIHDNGMGLSPEAAAVHLLDIGKSAKARTLMGSDQNAGFRGIGRLAGISYCKRLRFETSAGDGRRCTVEFDAAGINRLTARGQEPTDLVEAVGSNARIWEEAESGADPYLKVTLDGLGRASPFLNEGRLAAYLAQVAPVPFDPATWSFCEKITAIAEESAADSSIEEIKIVICDADGHPRIDVRRPFKDVFQTKDGNAKNPRTVNVTDIARLPVGCPDEAGWWGWIGVHEMRGALADLPFAGLRIRMHNIAVGDDALIGKLFTTRSLSRWCFGEIHVTDLSLIPNSQRNDFEQTASWRRLKERLREAAKLLEKEIRRESTQRNRSVATIAKKAEKEVGTARRAMDSGFLSQEEKQNTVRRLERTRGRLETEEQRKSRTKGEKDVLRRQRRAVETALSDVRAVKKTGTEKALAHLNKQARGALRVVFRVLGEELAEPQFKKLQQRIYRELRPGKRT